MNEADEVLVLLEHTTWRMLAEWRGREAVCVSEDPNYLMHGVMRWLLIRLKGNGCIDGIYQELTMTYLPSGHLIVMPFNPLINWITGIFPFYRKVTYLAQGPTARSEGIRIENWVSLCQSLCSELFLVSHDAEAQGSNGIASPFLPSDHGSGCAKTL